MSPLSLICRLLLILGALSLQACATMHTYSAKPITATVVDAETGEPLEGVNVVAHWVLRNRMTWGGVGDLELLETVTDKNGKFHFQGWEGKIPWALGPYETRLSNEDPAMIFFKNGYKPSGVGNDLQPERLRDENHTWERYSDWEGKVIKLEKFKGDPAWYGFGITTGLGSGIKCHWKKIPRFYVALMEERERLSKLGIRSVLPNMEHLENSFKNSGCGSAAEFFKEYLR